MFQLTLADIPRRTPFFYGWVIVACAIGAAFARQGAAVATLSVFINPMSDEFGWTRTAISGAVSLGGVLAAISAPVIGPLVDRRGARMLLGCAAVVVASACVALSQVTNLVFFYLAFAVGRLTFAGPFDIGISAAIANWFVRRRAQAMAFVNVGSTIGLSVMPMLAFLLISGAGWRIGWLGLAIIVIVMGALPCAMLMRRRPEDFELVPDGRMSKDAEQGGAEEGMQAEERPFTRSEAVRTPALWLLMAYTALILPVQAGISLHQAPHIIDQGFSAGVAASVVSAFALFAAISSVVFGFATRRWPIRFGLSLSAAMMACGAFLMLEINNLAEAYLSTGLFGGGVGGLLTLLPVVWANYFGRAHFGAIRGITLPVQVLAQALGPILAGALYDWRGSYYVSLMTLGILGSSAALVALTALPPRRSLARPATECGRGVPDG